MSGVEKAAGFRFSPFPETWGVPRGTADSSERSAWIREHVEQRRGVQSGRLAVLELKRKRWA